MLYGEENHRYKNATHRVAGMIIKGRGGKKSKATQQYTPLKRSEIHPFVIEWVFWRLLGVVRALKLFFYDTNKGRETDDPLASKSKAVSPKRNKSLDFHSLFSFHSASFNMSV